MTPALSHIEEAESVTPSITVTDGMIGSINPGLVAVAKAYTQSALDSYISVIRPAIAQALADRDDKLAQAGVRIEALKATISALTKGLEPITSKLLDGSLFSADGVPTLEAFGIDSRMAIVGAGRILAKQVIDRDARIEALEAALKPFADLADAYDDRPRPYSDTELIWCNHATVGQLRKARAALNQDGETK